MGVVLFPYKPIMAALQRAPVRQIEIRYPTPLIGDVLFSEIVDTTRTAVPAYGTAHPNTTKWPNHKLVFAREAAAGDSGRDGAFEFFYAADRANQDSYNFNFTKADIGGTRFDAVTRTYVTLRSAFTPNTPAMGAAMPNVPAGLFTGSYVLARREERRVGDLVLDGLFVAEELTYVKRCTIRDIGVDPVNGKSLVSSETLHYATETIIPGVTEPQSLTVSGTLTPDAAGTLDRVEDLSGFPQFSTAINGTTYPATRVYYNGTSWVLSHHVGPTLIPYALWTSAVCTLEECPSPSDATGWVPLLGVGLLTTGTPTITDTTPYTADITTSALFDAPTNAYWGLQTDGTQRSGKQLSCEWYLIESRQVVAGEITDGVVAVDTYTTNDRFYWPPVLETYELMDWEKKDGGVEIYPALRFHPEGYQGPCKNTITRTWSKTPFTIPVVEILQPTRIYYASPYFTVNIPECLHGEVAFQCDIRDTNDPKYTRNVGSTRYFAATNPDDGNTWPATIVAYDDQEPFRGGYLRTRRVVDRPAIPANVNWTTGAAI